MGDVGPDIMDIQGYADDHVVKQSFHGSSRADENDTIQKLENTITDIKVWINENRLKLTSGKLNLFS